MDFTRLNEISQKSGIRPTKVWSELESNVEYDVTNIKTVNTKFGQRIIMTFNNEFDGFLPQRIVKFLLDDIEEYTQIVGGIEHQNLIMHYIGGKYGACEFYTGEEINRYLVELDFTKLNRISRTDAFLPKKPWSELQPQTKYDVTSMKIVKTKYGDRIVIIIDDEYSVFLPERIAQFLLNDGEQFLQMLEAVKNQDLVIHYIDAKIGACEFQSKKKLLSTE
ncbi:hypothetical protein PV326_013561 [Microctonus aethiopoides]|nr:hypothetical protein PV326_013561 [Microctonus aethiopoides]